MNAILLTLCLAASSTLLLLLICTPLAWWLARTRSAWKVPLNAVCALPIVLPPTVLGFYLLVAFGSSGPIGRLTEPLGLGALAFSFPGILLGSVIYSLPFVLQPIQNSFESIGRRHLEAAFTLRASPWQAFWRVVLPLSKPGFLSAAILGFAHTVGEFGVVLMIGGNIPGRTRVLSIELFDLVEMQSYTEAHQLAGGLLVFSFLALFLFYRSTRRAGRMT